MTYDSDYDTRFLADEAEAKAAVEADHYQAYIDSLPEEELSIVNRVDRLPNAHLAYEARYAAFCKARYGNVN